MVPRNREFDIDDALQKAMCLFWKKGYAETSIRDLASHLRVSHAGIYSVFGDKEGLFKASIERYSREVLEVIFRPLEGPNAGRTQIEEIFNNAICAVDNGNLRNGCFIANSAVEFAGTDSPIVLFVQRSFERLVRLFENALSLALRNGEIRSNLNVSRVAYSFTVTFYGISAIARAGLPMTVLEEASAAALDQLD